MIQKNRIYVAVASLALLAGGIGMGYWWASDSSEAATAAATASNAGAPGQTGREVLYWYDPMVPDQRFDQPGKSPFMDMQLVPKYADEVSEGGISIAPGTRQNHAISTMEVEPGKTEVRRDGKERGGTCSTEW